MEQAKEYQLYQIAENQAGYFTLAQARDLELQRSQIYRGQKRNRFERAANGAHRFVQFPGSRFEEIHVAQTHYDHEQIELAIRQALRRGMTTKEEIAQQSERFPTSTRREIISLLDEIEL